VIDMQRFIDAITVHPDVYALRPDCAVLVVAIDQIANGPSDAMSRSWLEDAAQSVQADGHTAHLKAWRSAYRSFGVKPQKFRPSFDALMRRSATGLPSINRVVDAYNAMSVKYGLPVGGESIDAYVGPLRLVRASGSELFDTVVDGQSVSEVVESGEVVWMDDAGVTCRRWNWRQGTRTRVEGNSGRVFFLFESLAPFPVSRLHEEAEELKALVATSDSSIVSRLIVRGDSTETAGT
jgi:DNA/RNA-binding domain of Phe-tRNA-synthetase-like protein